MLNIITQLVNTTDGNITTLNEFLKLSITSQADEVRQTRLIRLTHGESHNENLVNTNILIIFSNQDITLTMNAVVVGDPTNTPVPVVMGSGKFFIIHRATGVDEFTIEYSGTKTCDVKIVSCND